jgi:hypothetical protein
MRLAERVAQTELIAWDQDQVQMIRHEAVDQHLRATRATGRRQQSPILGVVLIAKKGPLASMTALFHMMWKPWDNHSWKSRHRSVNPSSRKPHFVFQPIRSILSRELGKLSPELQLPTPINGRRPPSRRRCRASSMCQLADLPPGCGEGRSGKVSRTFMMAKMPSRFQRYASISFSRGSPTFRPIPRSSIAISRPSKVTQKRSCLAF